MVGRVSEWVREVGQHLPSLPYSLLPPPRDPWWHSLPTTQVASEPVFPILPLAAREPQPVIG